MKLIILGATGGTGLHLIDEALNADHEVIALVRNPDKITTKHDKLKVVATDLTDSSKLVEHLRGCDAVLSAIGGRGGLFRQPPCTVYTSVGEAVVKAMRESGVKRFVCVTSWGTKDDPNLPYLWRWVLKPLFITKVAKDMSDLEDYLMSECTDIDFTVVKPAQLLNSPSKGEKLVIMEGQCVVNYKSARISRQDVAKFVLECLKTEEYNKKLISIASS